MTCNVFEGMLNLALSIYLPHKWNQCSVGEAEVLRSCCVVLTV